MQLPKLPSLNLKDQILGGLKANLKKDANGNHIPDAVEHLQKFEKALDFVEHITEGMDHDEWLSVLTAFSGFRKKPINPQLLNEGAVLLAQTPAALKALEAHVQTAEKFIQE